MNRKLIAVDLDGTLLNTFKKVPEKNKQALIKAQEAGHVVMIATGRPLETTVKYAKEIQIDKYSGLVATYNGSVVTNIKTGEEIVNLKFDMQLLRKIIAYIDELEVDYSIMKDDVIYTNEHSKFLVRLYRKLTGREVIKNREFSKKINFTANKILLNDFKKYLKLTKRLLEEKFKDEVNISFSSPVSIEITPKGANKGLSILKMAQMHGIDKKDTITFGNTGNDESMIKLSGTGIAVKNASRELKELADYITLSNCKAGVGDYIEKYVLKEE